MVESVVAEAVSANWCRSLRTDVDNRLHCLASLTHSFEAISVASPVSNTALRHERLL